MPGFEPNDDDDSPVTVFVPNNPSEEVAAASLLEEAGIPFEVQNHQVQNVFGLGQLAGSTLALGPVRILVPAAYAAEASRLLEKGLDVNYQQADFELPAELAEPPLPEDPATRARSAARARLLGSLIFGEFLLAAVEVYDEVRALILVPSQARATEKWRFFALIGTAIGLGILVWLLLK